MAESFYAGYVAAVEANKDTKTWVAESKLVSEAFKKAYTDAMNQDELDADPILNARDVPSKPFKAESTITGEQGTAVILVSTFGDTKHRLKVTLIKIHGSWLVDGLPE